MRRRTHIESLRRLHALAKLRSDLAATHAAEMERTADTARNFATNAHRTLETVAHQWGERLSKAQIDIAAIEQWRGAIVYYVAAHERSAADARSADVALASAQNSAARCEAQLQVASRSLAKAKTQAHRVADERQATMLEFMRGKALRW